MDVFKRQCGTYKTIKQGCVYLKVISALTRPNRLRSRLPWRRTTLNALQHRSTKWWNLAVGLSPPLITYAISDVSTNGVRSLSMQKTNYHT